MRHRDSNSEQGGTQPATESHRNLETSNLQHASSQSKSAVAGVTERTEVIWMHSSCKGGCGFGFWVLNCGDRTFKCGHSPKHRKAIQKITGIYEYEKGSLDSDWRVPPYWEELSNPPEDEDTFFKSKTMRQVPTKCCRLMKCTLSSCLNYRQLFYSPTNVNTECWFNLHLWSNGTREGKGIVGQGSIKGWTFTQCS